MKIGKIVWIIVFLLPACIKESHNFHYSGQVFYPFKDITMFSEPYLENNQLSFAYTDVDTGQLHHVLNLNINHHLTDRKNAINTPGSYVLQSMLKTSSGNYLGACIDKSNSPYEYVVVQFDKNLNPIHDLVIRDSLLGLGIFKPLKNGDFILQYSCVKLNGFGLICFDKDLGIKWQKKISSITTNSSKPVDINVSENYIHVLSKLSDGNYFVTTLDHHGNKKGTSLLSNSTIVAEKVCGTSDGFIAIGHFVRADKRQSIFVHRYDLSSNLIESKIIETTGFSYGDVYSFNFVSDIIMTNISFYFAINVNNLTTLNEKISQVKLVKLQSNLTIEWVKMLDPKRKVNSNGILAASNYLLMQEDYLINVGKSIWNGMEGISIVSTDLDGNILE